MSKTDVYLIESNPFIYKRSAEVGLTEAVCRQRRVEKRSLQHTLHIG